MQRSEFTQYIEQNAKRALENPQAYKRRQAIVEHPYGTMKRQWGFDHIITKKTKLRASADVGLIFIAYNLTRIWNLIKQDTTTGFGISKALETAINLFLAYMAIFANHNKKIKMTLAV